MMYLLQVIVYTMLMYGIYMLVLKNKAQHNWSRWYLLTTTFLPMLIPFIKIAMPEIDLPATSVFAAVATEPLIIVNGELQQTASVNWTAVAIFIYGVVVACLLVRLLWQYRNMLKFVRSHVSEDLGKVKIIHDNNIEPGSWNDYIFLPEGEVSWEIINHELSHVRLRHSQDITCIRLLQCVCWPNIFLYVIEKELKIVHEFQADDYAGINKELYTQTLLNNVFSTNQFSLSHTFFQKPLKRRIAMLGKKAGASLRIKIAVAASLLTLLLVAGIVVLQGCKREAAPQTTVSINTPQQNETIYSYVDKMPESGYGLAEFIGKNLVYPESAKKNKIEGRVIVKFVVDVNGNVTNVTILSSPDGSLSNAALDVIKKLPKWTPGEKDGKKVPVYFTLPIRFSLDGSDEKTRKVNVQVPHNTAPQSAELTMWHPAFEYVDKMPAAPFDYNTFIATNVVYPRAAIDKKIEGRVTVKFIVDAEGNVQDPTILRSPDLSLSEAAIDVVRKMPKWIPGEKDGKKVPVYFTLPIKFSLGSNN